MPDDILHRISRRREADLLRYGSAQGLNLPERRASPPLPFPQAPAVICEIKRFSPSAPEINRNLDAVDQAQAYVFRGVRNISVLTEQNFFGGCLGDLAAVKAAFPGVSVLRKDFLLDEEDVDVSFQAGADAFLLIASLLTRDRLEKMYRRGLDLGMTPLVELHDIEDIRKASVFRPPLVGINSRDLKSFRIKPLQPLKIRALIDWDCRVVFESGVKTEADIAYVEETGFDAVLVGEGAVRDPGFAEKLIGTFDSASPADPEVAGPPKLFGFWRDLYERYREGRPLIKICGITSHADLDEIIRLGADVAGFVLAESPRQVRADFIRSCQGADILKVGVVVLAEGEPVPEEIRGLLREGCLDALQFHGAELPAEYRKWPGYKAVRIRTEEDVEKAGTLPGPAVLVDAWSAAAPGGTGKRIDSLLVNKLAGRQTLWLAGGITPDNVEEVIWEFHPDLIDLSSGVESVPGKKDHNKLRRLFESIERASRPEED